VPLLGDIPVIGALLFKYQGNSTEKRNLLVVLTPHIIHDQMDIERLVEKRTREQREFARTFSSLSNLRYRSDVDYRRKRGVLEEINRAVKSMESDAEILRELNENMVSVPDGEVRYFEGEDGVEGSIEIKSGDSSASGDSE
jgi:general secretion pathway protein D